MATTATNHWKLGLFVLLAVGVTLGTLFWLGARRFRRESFPAISYFDESVQGLDVGSPVKFRGVTVGTVSDITIAPDHRHVQVTADMYVDALVRLGLRMRAPRSGEEFTAPNLRVQLASAGITGVRFIQTDFFDPERFPPPRLPFEPPWNYVPSAPSTLKNVEETSSVARRRARDARRMPPAHPGFAPFLPARLDRSRRGHRGRRRRSGTGRHRDPAPGRAQRALSPRAHRVARLRGRVRSLR